MKRTFRRMTELPMVLAGRLGQVHSDEASCFHAWLRALALFARMVSSNVVIFRGPVALNGISGSPFRLWVLCVGRCPPHVHYD